MHRLHKIKEFALTEACEIIDAKGHDNVTGDDIDAIKDMVKAAKDACKMMAMRSEIEAYERTATAEAADEWGDADPRARQLFENLEHHYMGFWKYAAMHKRTGCGMSKAKMLEHFKHQLKAHDEIASFVRGNCPAACPEIAAVLQEWMASKK